MLVSIRMIRFEDSGIKVGVIILPGIKVTRCLGYRVLWQCVMGHYIFRGKRNRQRLPHTLAYGIRKKKSKCGEQKVFDCCLRSKVPFGHFIKNIDSSLVIAPSMSKVLLLPVKHPCLSTHASEVSQPIAAHDNQQAASIVVLPPLKITQSLKTSLAES